MKIQKQKIFGREYLKSPQKCFKYKDQFAASKFMCLNRCYIDRNLSLALDFEKKTQTLDLGSIRKPKLINKRSLQQTNEQSGFRLSKSENRLPKNLAGFRYCIEKCGKIEDCFQETYNTIRLGEAYSEAFSEDQIRLGLESTIYRAYYSTADFYLQFFGLLTRKKITFV